MSQKCVKIVLDIDPDTRPWTPRGQLEQVLINLMVNAACDGAAAAKWH